jgi:putative transposase
LTLGGCGTLRDCRYLLHDRDTKYTQSFRAIIVSGRVEPLVLPERWIRSVKEECLSKVILFGERFLRRALSEFVEQTMLSAIIRGRTTSCCSPRDASVRRTGPVQCRERLGGLLRYYHQEAA